MAPAGGHFGASKVLNRLHVNVKGTNWSYGSIGSLKSSFSFMCVQRAGPFGPLCLDVLRCGIYMLDGNAHLVPRN